MYKQSDFLIKHPKGFYYADEDKLARHLMTKHDFKTVFGKKDVEIYVFNGKTYSQNKAVETIKTECEKLLIDYCKTKTANEVLEKIKRNTAVDRSLFDEIPLNLIPFDNGVYDLETNTLLSFNFKYPFRFNIPVIYDPKATCKDFLKFLEETLIPEDIPVIQEWFGFNLYRRYFIKKGIIYVGPKDTGKTVLLNIQIKFIGKDNTSGISLQRITAEDKFALSSLYCKLQNVYDDLSSKDLNNGGGFKIVTGGGYITGEYKFGDSFTFLNYAKQTFACNKIPPIKDNDDGAYFDRWMPIEFLNPIPEPQQDKFLTEKLTSPAELSGILNWALEGLKRLLQNGKFSYSRSKEQVKNIMERSGDFLRKFSDDCLIEAQGEKISKEQMFELYTFWANKTESPRISKSQLGRRLESSVKYLIAKRDNERYWDNAKINFESSFAKSNKIDTLDAFKKTIREVEINNNIDNMIKKETSNPSNYQTKILDTLDASNKVIDEDLEVS